MKRLIIQLVLAFTLLPFAVFSQISPAGEMKNPEYLIGEWSIDLRPTPQSPAYLQTFSVESVNSKILRGRFYGSPIQQGVINSSWEKVYFAFTTEDQSNEYYHSGYIIQGKIIGTTYCPNRKFMTPWEGIKKD